MGDVLWNLEFALQLRENANSLSHSTRGRTSNFNEISLLDDNITLHMNNLSLGSEHEVSQELDDRNLTVIFLELVNLKGRQRRKIWNVKIPVKFFYDTPAKSMID